MRAALIRDGKVENVIVYDPAADFDPGEEFALVQLAEDSPVSTGWLAEGGDFHPPPVAPAAPHDPRREALLAVGFSEVQVDAFLSALG